MHKSIGCITAKFSLLYVFMFFTTAIKCQTAPVKKKNNIALSSIRLFSFDTLRQHAVLSKSKNLNRQQVLLPAPARIAAVCSTSTFYMHLKALPGQKIDLREIVTLTNGNYLLAGNLTMVNTEQAGMLCIMDNAGNIILQQQVRINNKPVTIFNARALPDGSCVISGIVHDVKDEVFVAHLNTDLTTNWLQVFTTQKAPLKIVLGLLPDNKVFFAAQTLAGIFYALLNSTGPIIWSQEIYPPGLDDIAGIGHNDFAGTTLVLNCTRAGKKMVELITLNPDDGTVLNASIVGDGTDNRSAGKVTSFASRFISLGVIKDNAAQFKLARDISYDASYLEVEHTYILPGTVDFNTTLAMDNAGDALALCLPGQGKMVYIRHFAYYQIAPEYTRQYTVPIGASMVSTARSLIDGGYLFGVNTQDKSECILIKTDSIGTLAGCTYEDISNIYTESIQPPTTKVSATATGSPVTGVAGAFNTTAIVLNAQADCNQASCPAPPPDDACLSSYYKTFRSNSYVDAFADYHLMRNNNHLMLTSRLDRIAGNGNVLTYGIKLFDEKGNFLKGVNVFSNGVTVGAGSKKVDDTHVALFSYSTDAGLPCYTFTMINDNLDIVWSKSFKNLGDFFGNVNFTVDKEGNFYLVANNLGFDEGAKVLVFKMYANGTAAWLKVYQIQAETLLNITATATNTSLIATIEGGPQGSVSLSFDKNTGVMQHAFHYNNSGAGEEYNRLLQFDNDRVFYGGNDEQENFTMGIFDTTGKPVLFKHITKSSIIRTGLVKDGMLYADYLYFNGVATKHVLLKADTALSLQYMREYDYTANDGIPAGMGLGEDGSIYTPGNYSSGGVNGAYFDPYLKKFDPNGIIGTCGYTNGNPVIENITLNTTAIDFSLINGPVFTPIDIPIEFEEDTYGQHINKLLCSSMPLCNSITVAGPDSICMLNEPFTYYAKRNQGCTIKPLWTVDTAMVQLTVLTDTSASLTFKKTGSTWVKLKLNTGCTSYNDSMQVHIQNSSTTLNLGNDTLLCRGDSLLLHAGKGFNAYLWQDNSTDSTLLIRQAGQYFVQVNTFCGTPLMDTINITAAAIPALSIGKDSSICFADTLLITASPGFNTYVWMPSTLISTPLPQQVLIISLKDENITLAATTLQGCTAFDTLKLTSIHARPIQLGADTSFCLHDSISLAAGNGYLQYTWSTGSQAPAIEAKQEGTYWVSAKDINGCVAKDTLVVTQVYALPVPVLGDDFSLCAGVPQQLDAGNFSQYLWQDGSLNEYYTVSTTGVYWVKVTDSHHCANTDTLAVIQTVPIPANFLKNADSVCQYEQLQISPGKAFATYLWSTGSVQQSITVSAAGTYSLKVQDANGCIGSDTIQIIQKNCISGVFIPTAFSPNGDVVNDVFKATVYGTIISFRLEIYNRYGEVIFSTADPKKGWDGSLKGIPQPSSSFVWQCYYQLAGSAITYKKGMVTLVR